MVVTTSFHNLVAMLSQGCYNQIPCLLHSGGSRNLERGVQQVGWYIDSAPPKVVCRVAKRDQSARSAENFLYVFFLAIRKRSRSISAHSGHIP